MRNEIIIFENQDALDKHHKSETMDKITKLREKYDIHMNVEKYVLDENNNKDEIYIRKQIN